MQNNAKNIALVATVLLVAAVSRLFPHPSNFTPMAAMAIFASATMLHRGLGLLIVVSAWFVSDILVNTFLYSNASYTQTFTVSSLFVYASLPLMYGAGAMVVSKITVPRVLAGSLSASVIFYLVSNFGVWVEGLMYPMTVDGMIRCYTEALPFFRNTLLGDFVYSGVFFVSYELFVRSGLMQAKVK